MAIMKTIKLDILDIPGFVNEASKFTEDIVISQNNAVVSAKSLMGINSLNLSSNASLIVYDTEDEQKVVNSFKKWII